jgi:hypothetical protein
VSEVSGCNVETIESFEDVLAACTLATTLTLPEVTFRET